MLPLSLVPVSASILVVMQLVGSGLELQLASGFSGARPAGAAPGRAHSPCLSFCSRSGRRTTEGQEAPLASGPWKELLLALRPTSPHTSEKGSLLVKPLGEQRNPAFGVPGPLWIEGVGGRLAGAELSKGVLSSVPSTRDIGRTASASC